MLGPLVVARLRAKRNAGRDEGKGLGRDRPKSLAGGERLLPLRAREQLPTPLRGQMRRRSNSLPIRKAGPRPADGFHKVFPLLLRGEKKLHGVDRDKTMFPRPDRGRK